MPANPAFAKRERTQITDGTVRIPIYPNRCDGRWYMVYREVKKGPRIRKLFQSLAEAKAAAREKCTEILNGRLAADLLTPEQRNQTAIAIKTLKPLGVSIDTAARELAEAHKISGGAGVLELARFWAKHHHAALSRKPIEQIHADLLATLSDHGLSARYWSELDNDLKKFCLAFKGRVAGEILSAEVLEYLRGLRDRKGNKVGWKRRNKIHSLVITLFRFARSERHLPQDRDTEPELVAKLSKPRDAAPPHIFTPAELCLVLANIETQWIPWIALGAFAGLRVAEIAGRPSAKVGGRQIAEIPGLQWSDVLFDDALIHIRPEVAKRTTRKVGDSRYIPMPENLLAWLRPWRNASGPVLPHRRPDRLTGKLGKLLPAGAWGQNPLRHSWVSYRSAETANLPLVADEAGNSTEISRTAYRNPRMKREAVVWFGILPNAQVWRHAKDWNATEPPARFNIYPVTVALENVIDITAG